MTKQADSQASTKVAFEDRTSHLRLVGNEVSRENFPLPTLTSIWDNLAKDSHHGKGFFSIRGLDPEELM